MRDRKMERKKVLEELTRKDILDSAVTVLSEKGIRKFTMDLVASGAGIAKATIYLHFKDKQDLLDSVVAHFFEPLEKELETIMSADRDPVRKLEQCALSSIKIIEKNKHLLMELRTIMNNMDQDLSDKESWYWTTTELIATALNEAVEAKQFRPMNTAKIAALFLDSINSLMFLRIYSSATETIEEDVQDLMDLYVNGLALSQEE